MLSERTVSNVYPMTRLGVTIVVPLSYFHVLSLVMKYFFKMYSCWSGLDGGGGYCFNVYLRQNSTNCYSNSSICVWMHKIKSNLSISRRYLGRNSSLQPLFCNGFFPAYSMVLQLVQSFRWFPSLWDFFFLFLFFLLIIIIFFFLYLFFFISGFSTGQA